MSFPFQIAATFPEAWPDALAALAPRMQSLALSGEDALALGGFSTAFRRRMRHYQSAFLSDALLAEIAAVLAGMPEGSMPRTGYCSWKGSTLLNQPARSLREVLAIITANDARIGEALAVQVACGDPVFLHLREWVDIPPWAEFRIFIRDRQVVGVSQYRWQQVFAEIPAREAEIRAALGRFLPELLGPLHMASVVADIFLSEGADGLEARLIELNPALPVTDSCLYRWQGGGDFDGGLRYRRGSAPGAPDDPWQTG